MGRFKGTKGIIILSILAVMVVGYYFYLSNISKESANDTEISAVQNILLRDLSQNYPPSPREVIKYYSEITKCFYDGRYTEEELEKLAAKAQELYDSELIQEKTQEQYISDLKEDIATFQKNSWTISSYAPSASVDVEYFQEDGFEFARLYCVYTIRQGTSLVSTNEVFLLRKDEEGHYKIFGWDMADMGNENK